MAQLVSLSPYRMLELEDALQSLMEDPHWSEKIASFTVHDWSLLKKLVSVLKDFNDATEALSSRSASIAEVSSYSLLLLSLSSSSLYFCTVQVIPIVSTIMLDLSASSSADHGVKGLKKELLSGMTKRMGSLESMEIYSVATLLHPR